MTAKAVPPPPFRQPMLNPGGEVSRPWQAFFTGLFNRVGGLVDKVDTSHTLAMGAVPQGTQIVAAGGLAVGGSLGGNVGVALYKAAVSVANLPTVNNIGDWAYAVDGRKNGEGAAAGTGTPVYWDKSGAWKTLDTGATVAA